MTHRTAARPAEQLGSDSRADASTVWIASLKFSPGLWKEFKAIGDRLQAHGCDVRYILSSGYACMGDPGGHVHDATHASSLIGMLTDTGRMLFAQTWRELLERDPPDLLLVYNPHPANALLAREVKRRWPGAETAMVVHDPYKPDLAEYGIRRGAYIRASEWLRGRTLRHIDHAIVPSPFARELFAMAYPTFEGEVHICPLLLDRAPPERCNERRWFSMIGHINRATGHNDFLRLIRYIESNGLGYRLAVATSSEFAAMAEELDRVGSQRVTIVHGDVLTEEEIEEVIDRSYAVFRLAHEVTQSGVIPLAYSRGVPVIARDIQGLHQHVWDGETGVIVPVDCTEEDIVDAMDEVRDNFPAFSRNARRRFEEIWSISRFEEHYDWLLDNLAVTSAPPA